MPVVSDSCTNAREDMVADQRVPLPKGGRRCLRPLSNFPGTLVSLRMIAIGAIPLSIEALDIKP